MKTLFAAGAFPKGGRSESSPTSNRLQNVTGNHLYGGTPSSMAYGSSAQTGRIPSRGHQELALMMSQLG